MCLQAILSDSSVIFKLESLLWQQAFVLNFLYRIIGNELNPTGFLHNTNTRPKYILIS